ncbi:MULTISPECIES: polysaccharide deacetylase family protein [unclassified Streptomyces]|uniref:polysaccharide deacetylase family protein n=1 Tax=unclassified Streptomyces TaxID=2593676 RepID=UPI002DD7C742|nr:polysaccharide deacetylase family protein [Streptomyces sp. NBC_01237]WRZ78514.1 polysaccharide deacetylase family protein [Streptomyces sp. NBC_01237]
MRQPRSRPQPAWLALIALAVAALLGGSLLAPAAVAGGRGDGDHHSVTQESPIGVQAKDLKGWAAAQRSGDAERRAEKGTKKRAGKLLPRLTRAIGPKARNAPAAPEPGQAKTLVLYDNAGPFGHLGELYAMGVANLGGRFGTVTAKPVQNYVSGELETFDATVYVGSTYYGDDIPDAVPQDLYLDILLSERPVIWMGENIWNMANSISLQEFEYKYGWDPTSSFYETGGSVGDITKVQYRGQTLTRKIPAGQDAGVLHPVISTSTDAPPVTELATAVDTAGATETAFPWAIRSANLTYLGEIPFTFVSETDRIIAFQDLLFDALAPATAEQHRALVRLEDISPMSNATQLRSIADYLKSQNIQYGINVIPVYTDPKGVQNNGVARTVRLAQRPALVNTLKYMLANGAVLMDHGYTHQYGNLDNPYNGLSASDFEFFKAHVDANDFVVYDGPVAEDSTTWAQGRITSALNEFAAVGLPKPKLWTTPHYAASATDYKVFAQNFDARLERSLYFAGTLTGAPVDSTRYLGQFFPYPVTDVYGTKVLPENIGSYEPLASNNNPPRLAEDLIKSAKANLAVRDGFASFYYHPTHPVAPLKEIVDGFTALGYTFVNPESLL